MREIIIASANRPAAERMRVLLQKESLFVAEICASGSEVLSFASIHENAVVICGKLSDAVSPYALAGMLPDGFDLLWLMPSGEPFPGYSSNMVTLNKPLNRMAFLNTVKSLALTESKSYSRKSVRTKKEEAVLTAAKSRMMQKLHISEQEAHALLQKQSMQSGKKLTELAEQLLNSDF